MLIATTGHKSWKIAATNTRAEHDIVARIDVVIRRRRQIDGNGDEVFDTIPIIYCTYKRLCCVLFCHTKQTVVIMAKKQSDFHETNWRNEDVSFNALRLSTF